MGYAGEMAKIIPQEVVEGTVSKFVHHRKGNRNKGRTTLSEVKFEYVEINIQCMWLPCALSHDAGCAACEIRVKFLYDVNNGLEAVLHTR